MGRFGWWAAAATVSEVGDDALYFAIGWTASAYGGAATGWVLAAISVPRVLLSLVGGAITDRANPRSVVLGAYLVLAAGCTAATVLVSVDGTPLWLLVGLALLLGIATAFQFPAAGALLRLVVVSDDLPRAMALRQLGFHVASLTGAPVGGLLVAVGGLALVLGANAATYLLVLGAVLLLRPARPTHAPRHGSLLGEIGAGLRAAWADRTLREVFGLYALTAGCAVPTGALLVPLLARERGLPSGHAGLVVGAIGLGGALTTLVVWRTGIRRRQADAITVSLAACAAGMLLLVTVPGMAGGVAAGLLHGIGLAAFIAHAGPVVVARSPATHVARLQAVLGVVQSIALIAMDLLLGVIAQATAAAVALTLAAVLLLGAAVGWRLLSGVGAGSLLSHDPGGGVRG